MGNKIKNINKDFAYGMERVSEMAESAKALADYLQNDELDIDELEDISDKALHDMMCLKVLLEAMQDEIPCSTKGKEHRWIYEFHIYEDGEEPMVDFRNS